MRNSASRRKTASAGLGQSFVNLFQYESNETFFQQLLSRLSGQFVRKIVLHAHRRVCLRKAEHADACCLAQSGAPDFRDLVCSAYAIADFFPPVQLCYRMIRRKPELPALSSLPCPPRADTRLRADRNLTRRQRAGRPAGVHAQDPPEILLCTVFPSQPHQTRACCTSHSH